jgi:hypothetical protein
MSAAIWIIFQYGVYLTEHTDDLGLIYVLLVYNMWVLSNDLFWALKQPSGVILQNAEKLRS